MFKKLKLTLAKRRVYKEALAFRNKIIIVGFPPIIEKDEYYEVSYVTLGDIHGNKKIKRFYFSVNGMILKTGESVTFNKKGKDMESNQLVDVFEKMVKDETEKKCDRCEIMVKLARQREENSKLRSSNSVLEYENTGLQAFFNSLNSKIKEKDEKIKLQSYDLSSLNHLIKELRVEIKKLKHTVLIKNKEIIDLNDEIESLKKKTPCPYDYKSNEVDNSARIEELEDINNRQTQTIKNDTRMIEQCQKRNGDLQVKIDSMQVKINNLNDIVASDVIAKNPIK